MFPLNKYTFAITLLCLCTRFAFCYDVANEFYTLAKTCKNENKIDKATSYYKQVLRINSKHLEAALDAAHMLYNANRTEEALVFYKQALEISDNYPEVQYNLGMCFLRLNKTDEAYEAFKEVNRQNPHYIKAYLQIGTIYSNKKAFNKAIQLYKDALKINPDSSELYHHLGRALRSLERYEEAVAAMEKAFELNPANLKLMLDLANTLHMVDAYERSLELYQKALEIKPDCTEALYNFGYTLKKCGDIHKARELFEDAIEVHTKALELRPDYPLAHFSRALSYLTLGNFELGWSEYEYRWQSYGEKPKEFSQPMWEGQDLSGKRILMYAEQGFGDTFQFVRYGKMLKDMGAHVIMQTQHRLKDIISQCAYLDEVVSDREPLPAFDYHIALMSIPMVVKTTIKTVPNEIPYLSAKEELCERWKNKLAHDKNFKIGICWQGNKQYRSIFLKKEVACKAMRLETFKPLASVPNVSLYSLQKINGTEQLNEVEGMMVNTFDHFDEEEGPFMDTAAIMKQLDLIITVDTSTGHLAAGLGAEVWVLLPFPADWRWMLDCNDTPWYPNMRLFRQPKRGDWGCVIDTVVEELHKRIQSNSPKNNFQKTISENKKKSTPSVFDQYMARNAQNTAPPKELPSQLGAVVDTMTQRSLSMQHSNNPQHIRSLIADHKVLQEKYQPYMEQSDELKNLTQQLLTLNKRLWQLEKELPEDRPSLFDEKFITLIHEVHKVYTIKNMVVQQINEISDALDCHKSEQSQHKER